MTLSSTTSRVSYAGNGSTAAFAVPFRFVENGHIVARLRRADASEVPWTEGTHYTLSGAGNPAGGTLTAAASPTDYRPASGETLVIRRVVPITQEIDYVENDPFPAEAHEEGLDLAAMRDQQLQEQIDRTLRFPVTDTAPIPELPSFSTRAGKYLGFNAGGDPTLFSSVIDLEEVTATGGTEARSLGDIAAVTLNVKDFGCVGDGLTDDTTAFQAALNYADANARTLRVPDGTYLVGALTIDGPMTLELSKQATVKLKDSANVNLLTISASDVTIRGGKIDGNRANQSSSGTLILATGRDRIVVEDIWLTAAYTYGIRIQDGDDVRIRRVRTDNTTDTAIQLFCTSKNVNRALVEDCVIDRSDDAANDGGCVKMSNNSGGTTYKFIGCRIHNVRAKMSNAPTGYDVVPLEIWCGSYAAAENCAITDCFVEGGAIGISLNGSVSGVVSGCAVRDADSIGIELADSPNCGVVGNTVDGAANTATGIALSGTALATPNALISGNTVLDCLQASSTQVGIYVGNASVKVSVTSNSVKNAGYYGIEINTGADDAVVTGNTVDGQPSGGAGIAGINVSGLVIAGNRVAGVGNAIQVVGSSGTRDNIVVTGNAATSSGANAFTQTGSNFGNNCRISGNSWSVGSGVADFMDLQNAIVDFSGTDNPTSSGPDWTGRGSTYRKRDGGVGLEFWTKTSAPSSAGWKPVAYHSSGNTASRPSPASTAVGYRYFDTDLGRMIWWNGTAWRDGDGLSPKGGAIEATTTWDPGSLDDGAGETSNGITVTGAALGDFVIVAAPYDLQGITATAYVSAADTVKMRIQNETGGTIDLASGTWRVRVLQA